MSDQRAERDAFGRVVTERTIQSLDDLLSDAEKAELHDDLAEIHRTAHPCWEPS